MGSTNVLSKIQDFSCLNAGTTRYLGVGTDRYQIQDCSCLNDGTTRYLGVGTDRCQGTGLLLFECWYNKVPKGRYRQVPGYRITPV